MEFHELDIARPGEKPNLPKGVSPPKSKLNKNNALKYMPFFIRALDTFGGKELFISADAMGYQVSTLQNRLAEALKFFTIVELSESQCKYKPADFVKLRRSIKLYNVSFNGQNGVVMRYVRTGISIEDSITDIGMDRSSDPLWKVQVDKFINNNSIKHIHIEGTSQMGTLLSPQDIEWLQRTFTQLDIEYDVNASMIKAIK